MSRKEFSENSQMSAAAYVEQARQMAAALEDREAASIGSRPIARARVARASGVPESLLHALRYRPPKSIAAHVYDKLCAAVERQAERQIGILQDEILSARTRRLGSDDSTVSAAEIASGRALDLLKRNG